jgi:hypothetical protein
VKAFAENNSHLYKIADKNEEHINPFDLADPTSSVDDKREAVITHSVPHIDQGVNEEVMSPDDVGESDEAKAVNFNDSTDGGAREDEDKEVDKKSEVIEVEASEIKERKIDPVFPEKIDQVEKVPESKENFWMILEHAGITKNKIIVFGGVLIALVAVALFFIFGGSDRKMTKPEVVVEDKPKVQQVKPVEDDVEERPYGIISSYIFGLEYQRQSGEIQAQPITSIGSIDGIEAGLIFGKVVNLIELVLWSMFKFWKK